MLRLVVHHEAFVSCERLEQFAASLDRDLLMVILWHRALDPMVWRGGVEQRRCRLVLKRLGIECSGGWRRDISFLGRLCGRRDNFRGSKQECKERCCQRNGGGTLHLFWNFKVTILATVYSRRGG